MPGPKEVLILTEQDQVPESLSGTVAAEEILRTIGMARTQTEEETGRAYISVQHGGKESGNVTSEKLYVELISKTSPEATIEKQAADLASFRTLLYREMGDTNAEADTEQAREDIRDGIVDIVILRNEQGDVVAYGETELIDLEPKKDGPAEAMVHEWMIGVHPHYRQHGLGKEVYARALKESLSRAYRGRPQKNVVALTAQYTLMGETASQGIKPTYPFIVDASGKKVEIKDPPLPQSGGSYVAEESKGKMYRWMLRFSDGRTSASHEDVQKILDAGCAGFADGEDEEYGAIVEMGRKFYTALLALSAEGRVDMLDDARRAQERSNGNLVEVESFDAWLKNYPALETQYAAITAAVQKHDEKIKSE
jgi:GNAT superfamily N-acetyltransferase